MNKEQALTQLQSIAKTLGYAAETIYELQIILQSGRYMCLDCAFWNAKDQKCNKYNCVPPPNIIMQVEKCPQFDIDVPF